MNKKLRKIPQKHKNHTKTKTGKPTLFHDFLYVLSFVKKLKHLIPIKVSYKRLRTLRT
jgi:hypothetical protein